MRLSVPFCVVDKAYVVWGSNLQDDSNIFLNTIDCGFYDRAVHMMINKTPENEACSANPRSQSQERKDISSLARLLWHHGAETFIMLLGSFIQAPQIPHAYFVKCYTEDIRSLAKSINNQHRPKYNRLNTVEFTIPNLLRGIHLHSGWDDLEETLPHMSHAVKSIIKSVLDEKYNFEYNSVKHGLRASHGAFSLAAEISDVTKLEPLMPDPIGFSQDSSFFDVSSPLNPSDGKKSLNFKLDKLGITWSLEKILCELRIISILSANIVSTLKISNGAPVSSVAFQKLPNDWWDYYSSIEESIIPEISISPQFEVPGPMPTSAHVYESYLNKTWPW